MTTDEMIAEMTAGVFFVNVEANEFEWSAELIEQDNTDDGNTNERMVYVRFDPNIIGIGASLALAVEDLYEQWATIHAKRIR